MKVAGDATLSRPKSTDFRMISPQKCGSKWWDSDLIHSVAKSWESAVGMANMTFFRHHPPVSSKVARWYNHLSMGQFPASHVGLLVHRVHQIVIYGNTWYIFRCKVPKITEKNHWKKSLKIPEFHRLPRRPGWSTKRRPTKTPGPSPATWRSHGNPSTCATAVRAPWHRSWSWSWSWIDIHEG